jgi:death-on-curing protein
MIVGLDRALILAIHDEQIARHGGTPGLRESARLNAMLARVPDITAAGEADIAGFAAGYALDIARTHPFIDGNRRAAFAALFTVLALNGMAFEPPEVEATMTVLGMEAGDLEERAFIAWVRSHARTPDLAPARHLDLHAPAP